MADHSGECENQNRVDFHMMGTPSRSHLITPETMTNKRAFVTAHKAQYAVSMLCRVLEISRGWFYGFLASQPARDQCHADQKVRNLALLPKINTFFKASRKCYGSKRIHQDTDPPRSGERR